MNFVFVFSHMLTFKAFWPIEAIKSCLPFYSYQIYIAHLSSGQPLLKGHCNNKVHACAFLINCIFLLILILSQVPQFRLEFHVPFETIYPPAFEFLFAKNIYHVDVVWRPCPSYFLPTCIHICSYMKFPIFVLLSFLPSRPIQLPIASSFRLKPLWKSSSKDIVFSTQVTKYAV